MPLIHIMYASSAAPDFREHQIPDLLQRARAANEKQDITGMLLYIGGSFFSVAGGRSCGS
jgi:hypothetical protein